MDYYNISIKQLISEIKRKETEIANMKSKLKGYEEQKKILRFWAGRISG